MRIFSIFLFFYFFFVFFAFFAKSAKKIDHQHFQKAYHYFLLKDYDKAKKLLKKLMIEQEHLPKKKAYPMFYYALSAYHCGEKNLAAEIFYKIQDDFPKWKKIDEVKYWLSNLCFQNKDYERALQIISQIKHSDEEILQTKKYYLKAIQDVDVLTNILDSSLEKDPSFSKEILKKLIQKTWVNLEKYQSWIQKYQLTDYLFQQYGSLPTIKKKIYHVALILPFFTATYDHEVEDMLVEALTYDDNDTPEYIKMVHQSKISLDFYKGIWLAVKKLAEKNIMIQIHPYDSQGNVETVKKILNEKILQKMDLIIGPLEEACVAPINTFSKKNQITLWHPFTQHIHVIDDNPYAFLFQSSISTQIKAIKKWYECCDQIQKCPKKIAIIYGESADDQARAYFFKKFFETSDSSEKVILLPIDLTAAQSMLYKFKNDKITEKDVLSPVVLENITHLYIASNDDLLVNNILGILAFLKSSAIIIGHTSWIHLQSISLTQLQRMHVQLIQDQKNYDLSPQLADIRIKFLHEFCEYPANTSVIGYQLMFLIGPLLHTQGRYFMKKKYMHGIGMAGYDFTKYRDDQQVNIFFLQDGSLQKINPTNQK